MSTITGCTSIPVPGRKFCHEHESLESPVIPADAVTAKTKNKLREHRKKNSHSDEARNDNAFVVESILDMKKDKVGIQYLVKWLGFPQDEATWEPEDNLPKFLRNYYNSPEKYGMKLPDPKIKYTKTIGGIDYHFLQWEGENVGNWFQEDFFKIMSEDGELVSSNIDVSCNTRKSRDKRERKVKYSEYNLLPYLYSMFGFIYIVNIWS